jgi:YVTN family beta-propeller protein
MKFLLLLIFSFMLTGCHGSLQKAKALQENDGETYLYLHAFPQEAARISFELQSAAAVNAEGVEIPLTVRLSRLKGEQVNRQRLIASGALPPGKYRGFSFSVKDALLKGEDGEAALLVPEHSSLAEYPFEVKKAKAMLFSVALKYQESITEEVRFNPIFSVGLPGRPVPNLTGYVVNRGSNTITVFDKKSHEAMDVIQTGRGPGAVVLDQRQRRAYVVLSGEDAIDVIDVALGSAINRIRLHSGDAPRDLALTPDGSLLITANTGSNTVSLIDPASFIEIARISLSNRPGSVLIDRLGKKAYIFNTLSNNISVLDIANRVIITTFSTDSTPLRGDFNRKGDKLAVFQEWSPHLLVVDAVSLATLKKVYVGIGIGGIKVDTNTDNLYVGRRQDGMVEIFDPFSYIPGNYLSASAGTSYMAIDGEENNLYLIHPAKNSLQIFNLVSGSMVGEIDVDDDPYWVTLMGER